MARNSTLALAALTTRMLDTGVYDVVNKMAFPASGISNADIVEVMTVNRNGRLTSAVVNAKATLGASATIKLQRYRASDTTTVDITGATTAGGASLVTSAAIGPQDVVAGDVIQLLVGGANVSAAASVEVDVHLQH